MLKNISLLIITLFILSCQNETTLIDSTELPNEPNEIYETNFAGFITNEDRELLADATIRVDNQSFTSQENGLFHFENVLVKPRGKVLAINKEGYLPLYKRVYNHRSNEAITINAQMLESPAPILLDGSLRTIDGNLSKLTIGEDVYDGNTSLTYYNHFDTEKSIDMDMMIEELAISMLDIEALWYIHADVAFSTGLPSYSYLPSTDSKVYYYDENELTWKEVTYNYTKVNGGVDILIDKYGWWAIAKKVPANYGTIQLVQKEEALIGKTEVVLEHHTSKQQINEVFYTDSEGKISKFFPIETYTSIYADNENLVLGTADPVENNQALQVVKNNTEIINAVSGQTYDCNLNNASGWYAILTSKQQFLGEFKEGNFTSNVLANEDSVEVVFYDDTFTELVDYTFLKEDVADKYPDFVLCENRLTVKDDGSTLGEFSDCTVRIKPNETIVVGDNGDIQSVFLMSFKGETPGLYEGLVFSNSSFGDDLGNEVDVEVKVFDELTNRVAGTIRGVKRGTQEPYDVLFIGNKE